MSSESTNNDSIIPMNPEYINPTPGCVPIVAMSPWIEMTGNKWNIATHDDFRRLKSCGFNLAMFTGTNADVINASLGVARECGFPCVFMEFSFSKYDAISELLPKINGQPMLKGYTVKDEPTEEELREPDATSQDPNIGWVRDCYFLTRELAPDKLLFMTLAYKSEGFYNYLQSLNHDFTPALWCYDVYPVLTRDGRTYCTSSNFYEALRCFHDIAEESRRPFWAFCMSVQYFDEGNDYSRHAPTLGNLRYEAFSALAYGAQGIVYWYYAQRGNSSEEYISAPVNINNQSTDIWCNIQAANSEIAQYSSVFLGCSVVNVLLKDASTDSSAMSELLSFTPFDMVSAAGEGVLVSHIRNNGHDYLVVVSKDPFHAQQVTLRYRGGYLGKFRVFEMTPNFLASAKIGIPAFYSILRNLELDPGGYAIVRWDAK